MIELFDTHCHMHELEKALTPVHDKWFSDKAERTAESVLEAASQAGVTRLLVIGTTLADSQLAVEFAQAHDNVWASIGIHPHEAKEHLDEAAKAAFAALAAEPKVVAVGECGLDYFYAHSPKEAQVELLHFQIALAQQHDLPISFHVREAFPDFWPIFESYDGLRGVLHSFTDSLENMQHATEAGLYIGVNGIATFAKNGDEGILFKSIPDEKLLLETDAPFLTPIPYRGKVCESKHVRVTAEFLSGLRGQELAVLARNTTANARELFKV